MAIALVQRKEAGSPTLQGSLSVTLDAPATAGNLLVCYYAPDKASGTITKPTGFSDAIREHTTGTGASGALFYKVAAGGEQVISASHDGGNRWIAMAALEFSGATATPLDQSSITATGTGTARSVTIEPTAATEQASELALAFWSADSSSSIGTFSAPTDGFDVVVQTKALGDGSSCPGLQVASKTLSVTGSVTTTLGYTGGNSQGQLGIIATFKAAAGGGGGGGGSTILDHNGDPILDHNSEEILDTSSGAAIGSFAATDGADAAALAGDVLIDGTLSGTEGSDAAALAGSVPARGALTGTDGSDTAALAGEVVVGGFIAATEGADAAAFEGAVAATRVIVSWLEFSGVVSGAATVHGSIDATEGSDAAALLGVVLVDGSLAATEDADLAALAGSVAIQGAVSANDGADTADVDGQVIVRGGGGRL